jgi:hypothetical protein
MGDDRSFAAETKQVPAPGSAKSQRSQSSRRPSLDFTQRRSLTEFDRGIPLTDNLLEAASGLGRTTDLAQHLARLFDRIVSASPAVQGGESDCIW